MFQAAYTSIEYKFIPQEAGPEILLIRRRWFYCGEKQSHPVCHKVIL